jgi:hypothetical protein
MVSATVSFLVACFAVTLLLPASCCLLQLAAVSRCFPCCLLIFTFPHCLLLNLLLLFLFAACWLCYSLLLTAHCSLATVTRSLLLALLLALLLITADR